MADVKELFGKAENGTLTYEQFMSACKEANAKFADLNEGNYVSKRKYTDDLATKDSQIESLNGTLSTRDNDLADLKAKLEAAGTDAEKISALTNDLATLQGKYDEDTKAFEARLTQQAYEFAVKDFASGKKFTSQAAKRDFIQSMIAENLKLTKNGEIYGADKFVETYSKDNADAFVVENPAPEPNPNPAAPESPKPQFVSPTPGGQPAPVDSNAFAEAFHFAGVRPIPTGN